MIKKIYKNIIAEKTRNNIIYFIRHITAFVYYGDRYYCNCCKKSFRKFLPKGNVKRKNAMCPYCFSLERTRLLHLYLENETEVFRKQLKVLHIAPEKCLYNILKKLNIEYIDGDINPANATHIIDITDIQYPDSYFDLIICSHVLGHVPDEQKAISELLRVLKKDGTTMFLTLINSGLSQTFEDINIITPEDRLTHYGEPDLCRLHGMDFQERIEKQGFVVKCIDYRENLSDEICTNYSLGDGQRELIFEGKKIIS